MDQSTVDEKKDEINVEEANAVNELSLLKLPNEKETGEKQNETKKKITFLERLKLIKDNTTVEPIMICYLMPSMLASLASQKLYLEKACRVNLNLSSEICGALSQGQIENYTEYEEQVQTVVAGLQGWITVIQTSIPLLIILFVGAWSDKTGKRKACILLPIAGDFLTCIGTIINIYFFNELSMEVLAVTESIFPALTGGWSTNSIGVFSYIGDITTDENRTYRLGILNLCMTLGGPVGTALSGVLLSLIGYYGISSLSASLYLFALVYGYIYLEDPKRKNVNPDENPGCSGFFREFFDYSLAVDTFKVLVDKGAVRNRRLRISLLLIVVCVAFGPMYGEMTIMYLYTRFAFNWNEVQYSVWSTYSTVINLIGTLFSMSLFSGYMNLDDSLLGIISNASKIFSSFGYAFARTNWGIYLTPLIDILSGTSYIATRALASKLVDSEEIGKINSILGLAEATMPLIYGPLYASIYMATLSVMPGAVFLVGAGLTVFSVSIFGWLYYEHKKDLRLEKIVHVTEKNNTIIVQ